MIITIDGPAASGKSTIAQMVARALHFNYLNTGLLFRAVAYILVAKKHTPEDDLAYIEYKLIKQAVEEGSLEYQYDAQAGVRIMYNNTDIGPVLKQADVDRWASIGATNAHIRKVVREFQKKYAQTHSMVADGRDLGTIVFTDAECKFFLTADLKVRAGRWRADQEKKGNLFTQEQAEDIIKERDTRDKMRHLAPLVEAADACLIDNSTLTLEKTVDKILAIIKSKA